MIIGMSFDARAWLDGSLYGFSVAIARGDGTYERVDPRDVRREMDEQTRLREVDERRGREFLERLWRQGDESHLAREAVALSMSGDVAEGLIEPRYLAALGRVLRGAS